MYFQVVINQMVTLGEVARDSELVAEVAETVAER